MRYATLPLRVLIVDSDEGRRNALHVALELLGQTVFDAEDPRTGVTQYSAVRPDLVLLDVADGMVALLREADPERRIPIALLCANTDAGTLTRCLESGADWALPRNPSAAALRAVLGGAERLRILENQLSEKSELLKKHAARLEDEMILARKLLKNVREGKDQIFPEIQSWISPASKFSGDVIIAERSPAGAMHMMLADGVGHGLAATFVVMPLTRAFRVMTEKGFGLPAIVAELNHRIRAYDMPDLFVAATLVSHSPGRRSLEVWNGGTPDAFLVGEEGEVIRRFPSRHLPLGVLEQTELDTSTEIIEVAEASQFVVYSDGLLEACGPNQQAYGEARLLDSIAWCAPGARHHTVAASIRSHLAGGEPQDDISFAVLNCVKFSTTDAVDESVASRGESSYDKSDWGCTFRFGSRTLKSVDVVPIIQHMVREIDESAIEGTRLYVVLSELFNNALDHGLLGLSSQLKDGSDGFERYLDERTMRLAELKQGEIEIEVTRLFSHKTRGIRIRVRDSGEGFDHHAYLANPQTGPLAPYGRGIHLVRSMATSVVFSGCGNTVEVVCAGEPAGAAETPESEPLAA